MSQNNEFENAGEESRSGLVAEFWSFLKFNKKWWLLPILLLLAMLGLLAVFGSSAVAPFIYTLF